MLAIESIWNSLAKLAARGSFAIATQFQPLVFTNPEPVRIVGETNCNSSRMSPERAKFLDQSLSRRFTIFTPKSNHGLGTKVGFEDFFFLVDEAGIESLSYLVMSSANRINRTLRLPTGINFNAATNLFNADFGVTTTKSAELELPLTIVCPAANRSARGDNAADNTAHDKIDINLPVAETHNVVAIEFPSSYS